MPAPETRLDSWLDLDNSPVIEHLRDRRVIHTWSKQQLARRRRALLRAEQARLNSQSSNDQSSSDQSNSQPTQPSAGAVEIQPPTSEQAKGLD
jgi:hypothetical protein